MYIFTSSISCIIKEKEGEKSLHLYYLLTKKWTKYVSENYAELFVNYASTVRFELRFVMDVYPFSWYITSLEL